MLWRLLVVAVRPLHLGAADPAPFGHAVLVMLSRLPVTLEAVDGGAVDVVHGLVGAVLVAEPGGVADVVLARLVETFHAVDGLVMDVIGADFLVALAAVEGDADEAGRRDLAEAAIAARRAQQRPFLMFILAADRARLGVDAFVLPGH